MQSMDEIYQQHAQTVFKYLMSLTGDMQLSEELTQETFYQAIRSVQRFDGSCKITTWLCAIARNQLYAYKRKHPVMQPIDEMEDTVPSAEHEALVKGDRVGLMKKLHGCPEPFREVMYLRIFGNLSFREIGDIMEKSENWARVTYYRGKEKLRKEIGQDEI